MFEATSIVFAAAGLAVFAAAVLPKLLRNAPLSMPMVFLAAGMLAFTFIPSLPDPDPVQYGDFTTHLTEVCVIISLMGAGLALDRPVGLRRWSTTWRMLGLAMPLCIVGLTLLGLGPWDWASAPPCSSAPHWRPPTRSWPPRCRWGSRPTTKTRPSAARTRSGSA